MTCASRNCQVPNSDCLFEHEMKAFDISRHVYTASLRYVVIPLTAAIGATVGCLIPSEKDWDVIFRLVEHADSDLKSPR